MYLLYVEVIGSYSLLWTVIWTFEKAGENQKTEAYTLPSLFACIILQNGNADPRLRCEPATMGEYIALCHNCYQTGLAAYICRALCMELHHNGAFVSVYFLLNTPSKRKAIVEKAIALFP